jgi:hypothetical protein
MESSFRDDCDHVLTCTSTRQGRAVNEPSALTVDDVPSFGRERANEMRDAGVDQDEIKGKVGSNYALPAIIGVDSRAEEQLSSIERDKSASSTPERDLFNNSYGDENRPTRFEELHQLGTQALLLKRTLSYIQVIHESKRNIKFDILWNEKREKNKTPSTRETRAARTERLYNLSKSKQMHGKNRRKEKAKPNIPPDNKKKVKKSKRLNETACSERLYALSKSKQIEAKKRLQRKAKSSNNVQRDVSTSRTKFDDKLKKKREKQSRRSPKESPSMCSERLYGLSKSRQLAGKKRLEEIQKAREEKLKVDRAFNCIVGFDPDRISKESGYGSSVYSGMTPYTGMTPYSYGTSYNNGGDRSAKSTCRTAPFRGRQKTWQNAQDSCGGSVYSGMTNSTCYRPKPASRRQRAYNANASCGTSVYSGVTNATNATTYTIHDRLYNMSRSKQTEGRKKREQIEENQRRKPRPITVRGNGTVYDHRDEDVDDYSTSTTAYRRKIVHYMRHMRYDANSSCGGSVCSAVTSATSNDSCLA